MRSLLLLAGLFCALAASAQQPADDFTQLVNGTDLGGWTRMNAGSWVVEGGALKYTGGGNGWLRSNETYKDFQVIVEWRYLNEGNNDAGLFFRAGPNGNPWPSPAYQLNMGPAQNYASVGGGVRGARARFDLIHKVGEWNTYDLLVIGDKATLLVNGQKAWDAFNLTRTETGHLGFQAEGHVLEVRSVKVRKFGEPAPRSTASATFKERLRGNNTAGPYALQNSPIITESEVVRIGGAELRRGVDYRIDYVQGRVMMSRPVPSAELISVDYQYNHPPFSNRSLGLRIPLPPMGSRQPQTIREEWSGNGTVGPFSLSFRPIVAESEAITVAGVALTRGQDYTLDLATGTVTFKRVVAGGSNIVVTYKSAPPPIPSTGFASGQLRIAPRPGTATYAPVGYLGIATARRSTLPFFSYASFRLLQQANLESLLAPGAKVELVKDGFQFTEGPMCGNRGSIYFTDVRSNQICRINTTGEPMVTLMHENTNGANGLFMKPNGEIIAACGTGAKIASFAQDKSVKTIADKCGGQPLNRPNDLTVAKDGRIYFTAPGARPMAGQTATQKPSVHLVKPDGAVLLLDDTVARPNGILLSLDEKTLFVANSLGVEVLAYDVQPDGTVKNRRAFATLRDVQMASGADGMCLDLQGNLYITSNTGVQAFNSKGAYVGTIAVPKKPSNCAFAGVADRKTLYITAQDSIFRIRTNTEGPKDRAK